MAMAVAMGMFVTVSGRDRTLEFVAFADRLRKSSSSSLSSLPGDGETVRLLSSSQAQASSSEFNKRASQIGLTFNQMSQKMAKLSKCE